MAFEMVNDVNALAEKLEVREIYSEQVSIIELVRSLFAGYVGLDWVWVKILDSSKFIQQWMVSYQQITHFDHFVGPLALGYL